MSIATLKLDQSAKLEFAVSITGASGTSESRLVIEGKDFSVSYPCKPTNEGVEVELTGLSKNFSAGEYNAKLEVFLENKVYVPLRETIIFEPSVEVVTKSKPVQKIEESVKVGKIVVKNEINENFLRKTQAATIIAQSLGYHPEADETPHEIIEHAVGSIREISTDQLETLKEMLKLAESVGIDLKHINLDS
jgi:hypothetical protein